MEQAGRSNQATVDLRPGSGERARGREPGLGALERAQLRKTPGFYRRSWNRFRKNHLALGSLMVIALIGLFVLSAGLISRYVTGFSYSENHLADKLSPPMTNGYVLGSDGNGRDILTRLAYGGRVSLMIAFLSTFATLVLGGGVGLVSGYFGGWVDSLLMRLVDVLLAIPGLALLILITTLYRPGPVGLAFVLAGVSWPGIARIIRGEVLSLRRREYIEAARVVGAPAWRILTRHLLPNIMPLIVIYAAIAIPVLIVDEAALSYLGVGVQVPTPSWGNMLGEATQFLRAYPAKVIIPGAMIYLTSLALYLVGNGIRDAFDPRLGD